MTQLLKLIIDRLQFLENQQVALVLECIWLHQARGNILVELSCNQEIHKTKIKKNCKPLNMIKNFS